MTHLYSSCSYLHRNGPYREGGVVEAAFLLRDLDVEVIADGVHLPPLFLRLIYGIKGAEHITLVTDCIRPGGVPCHEGDMSYDDVGKKHPVYLENDVAVVPDRSSFAGSIATTLRLVRTMVQKCGVGLPLRYNYDKPENPRISRVFGYQARFFILFQPEKSSREVVIS